LDQKTLSRREMEIWALYSRLNNDFTPSLSSVTRRYCLEKRRQSFWFNIYLEAVMAVVDLVHNVQYSNISSRITSGNVAIYNIFIVLLFI
jgi:hypothetical protein